MSAELDRLAAEFEKFQRKIKQAEVRFGNVAEMQERIADLEAVATSPDRSVRVVAGPGGAVKDIQLTPDAMRLPSTGLAATIMATLREAVAEAARRQAGIVDETVGGQLGAATLEHVHQAQAEAFGATEGTETFGAVAGTDVDERPSYRPEPSTPPAPSAPSAPARRRARTDDDDYSEESIFD